MLDISAGTHSKCSVGDVETYTLHALLSDFRQSKKSLTTQSTKLEDTIMFDPTSYMDIQDSKFNIPLVKEEKMPEYVTVTLKETSTEYIFELPSKTAERDTDEGFILNIFFKMH